jgi:hypothetical protein
MARVIPAPFLLGALIDRISAKNYQIAMAVA